MLEVFNFLASYGFFRGGDIGNVLAQWQAAGVFSYALPFLLLFALTFGLLCRINLFSTKAKEGGDVPNKSINAIIALSVSLMSLQFDFVSMFFAEIFPRFGVALSIILVILILGGIFMPLNVKGFSWGLIGVVFIIAGIVIFSSLESFGYGGAGYWFRNNLGSLLPWAILIGLVVAVVAGATSTTEHPKTLLGDILGSYAK